MDLPNGDDFDFSPVPWRRSNRTTGQEQDDNGGQQEAEEEEMENGDGGADDENSEDDDDAVSNISGNSFKKSSVHASVFLKNLFFSSLKQKTAKQQIVVMSLTWIRWTVIQT